MVYLFRLSVGRCHATARWCFPHPLTQASKDRKNNPNVYHEKRSNRWYRLKRIKAKILAKLNAQLKDAEHKITSRFISDCLKAEADTIVIGKLKGIQDRVKFSKKSNQKIHQWAFARLQSMICYKAERAGLTVKFVSEAYTSRTCPKYGNRKKPTNRNYHCNHCGFEYHRDGVGAINLWRKVSGRNDSPVVGVMASPIGVRFHSHLSMVNNINM